MILINLLPEAYREKRKTPLKYMAAVAATVAVNGSLLAFWAWTAFGVAAEVSSELAVLKDTKAGLDPQVNYHRELEAESKVFQARGQLLDRITSSRVGWTRKLDELIELVNRGGEEKYLVWFKDLEARVEDNARGTAFGHLKAEGYTAESLSHVANFLEDVSEHEFSDVFGPPRAPEGQSATTDEGLFPANVWTFPLQVDLKSPEERKELRKGTS